MTLELIKPHTHAGRLCAPGERLDLDEATARWLIEQGVARTTDATPDASPKTRKGD
ncbi:MAG TPA: hypothetical protein VF178_13805 [Gemmatimonadaceae bacterium]|jgi:hypothetical protein